MIGFTSTTFRPFTCDAIMRFAKKANAQCIEWGGDVHVKNVDKAKYVKNKCDDLGINICSYGAYYKLGENNLDKFKEICEITSAMDAKRMRIWYGNKGSAQFSEQDFENIVKDAKNTCKIAKDYGILLCGECHPDTYNDTTKSSLKLLKAVDESNFLTYYQSWYLDMNYDLDRFKQTLDYTNAIHISFSEMRKNQRGKVKDDTCCHQIMQLAKSSGFDGDILLEYVKLNSPRNFYKDMALLMDLYK